MSIKITTLTLMAVFYICYFAKMLNQRKQGISTDQLGKGKEGFVRFIDMIKYKENSNFQKENKRYGG